MFERSAFRWVLSLRYDGFEEARGLRKKSMNCSLEADSLLQPETMGLPGGIKWGIVQSFVFLWIFGKM